MPDPQNTPGTPPPTPGAGSTGQQPAAGTPPAAGDTATKIFDANAAGSKDAGTPPQGGTPQPAAGEGKPAGDQQPPKPGDATNPDGKKVGDESKDSKPPERVVPEKYELKLPDGSLLDSKAVEKIATFAKENGLTNTEAQAVLERENQAVVSYVEGQREMLAQKQKEWVETVKNDKELGGDGFTKNVEMAKRVVERYGSDALKQALTDSGLGNHPELVRFVARIGHAMSEDQLVIPGAGTPSGKKFMEDIFYPQSAAAKP